MDTEPVNYRGEHKTSDENSYRFLRAVQIEMIDEALAAVGEFGEVHLVVENRRLRFVVTQRSSDVLKWQPGNLAGHHGHGASSAR